MTVVPPVDTGRQAILVGHQHLLEPAPQQARWNPVALLLPCLGNIGQSSLCRFMRAQQLVDHQFSEGQDAL